MLEVKKLTAVAGDKKILDDFNLSIMDGEVHAIMGPNGTGKSTLFKLILGEEQPDGGEIAYPKGYKIGALKQYFNFTEKTLLEETALALGEDDKYNIYGLIISISDFDFHFFAFQFFVG